MKAFAYISRTESPFSKADLKALISQSEASNFSHGITGYLHYRSGRFFQYIEGDAPVVSDLMALIRCDLRHTIMNELEDGHLRQRRFPDWGMRSISPSEVHSVEMEDIIEQHFECIRLALGGKERWEKRLWSSVDKIADLQERLKTISGRARLS